MVKTKEDLTGRQFGRLTVIAQTDDYIDSSGKHYARWVCECSCDEHKIITVRGSDLKNKHSLSCGCLAKEKAADRLRSQHKTNNYSELLSDKYGYYYIGFTTNTNKEFFIDEDDYDKIKDYCWCEHILTNGYHALETRDPTTNKIIRMHWIIVGKRYDHEDRNPLNNRKYNLRKAAQKDNSRNISMKRNNTSGVMGVFWHKKNQNWMVIIGVNKKSIYLGSFVNKEEAIRVRLKAEQKYFGEFAPQRHLFEAYGITTKE
jgi:hypothetical protein